MCILFIKRIIPETAHPAYKKACHYFNVEYRGVPVKDNFKLNTAILKKLIDKNTILIVASYPESVYGLIDPID